jgi:hypothetical protein
VPLASLDSKEHRRDSALPTPFQWLHETALVAPEVVAAEAVAARVNPQSFEEALEPLEALDMDLAQDRFRSLAAREEPAWSD